MRIGRFNKVHAQVMTMFLVLLLGSMALGSKCFVSKSVILTVIQK